MRSGVKVSLAVFLLAGLPGLGRADRASEAIVDQAIRASGGAARLAKYTGMTWKSKGTFYGMGEGTPYTGEWAMQMPDKERTVIEADANGSKFKMVIILNGKKGWVQFNDNTAPLGKDRLKEATEELYAGAVGHLVMLKNKGFTLSPLGEVKVDGREAVGVKVASKGHRDVNLFFDKRTHLLAKTEATAHDENGTEVKQETYLSDYKTVEGVKVPAKVVIKRDGKKYVEGEATDYKLEEKLDDSLFSKP